MVESKRKTRSSDQDTAVNQAKRQRVSRACDQCRVARERCDGTQPICFTCASTNRECTYTTNPKRRGIQPGYIRTLELTLAWVLTNVNGSEDAVIGLLQEEEGQALISSANSSASNKLHRKWRNNIVCKAIDRVLSGEGIEDLLQQTASLSVSENDEEGDEDKEQAQVHRNLIPTPDSSKVNFNSSILDERVPQTSSAPVHGGLGTEVEQGGPSKSKLHRLPTNYWRLIEIYFSYTHSWLPIASKEHILKLCYSYPSEGVDLTPGPGTGDHAELWSILALASIQNAATEDENRLTDVQTLRTAEGLVCPIAPEDHEVGHVSALLTLALINIAIQKFSVAWFLLGRAARSGRFLQSQMEQHEAGGLTPSLDRLKATLRGCFVVETILSSQLQIIPSLRTDYATSLGLFTEEGLDEWQPWTGCEGFRPSRQQERSKQPSQAKSTFNHLLRLCYILNNSLVDRTLGRFMSQVPASLAQWLATLPPTFGAPRSSTFEQTSPQKAQLFVIYLVERAQGADKRSAIQEFIKVLDHFMYNLGAAAMPPLFACLLKILIDRSQGDAAHHNRLVGTLGQFTSAWKDPRRHDSATNSAKLKSVQTFASSSSRPPYEHNRGSSLAGAIAIPQSPTSSLHNLHTSPMQIQQPTPSTLDINTTPGIDINTTPQQAVYDSNFLTRYNSSGSMDLDALFDDFTSFDTVDSGIHPQFMQNLGFDPGANLADLMRDDFGWGLPPG